MQDNTPLNVIKYSIVPASFFETLEARSVLPDHGLTLLPYLCGCDVAHRRGSLRVLTCPAHFARRVAS